MKTKPIVSVSLMAVLLVAGPVFAQYSSSADQATTAGYSPTLFVGPDGQTYMVTGDASAIPTTAASGGMQLASHYGGMGCDVGCGCGDVGCAAIGCTDLGCGDCGVCTTCCGGAWTHRVAVFGEFLSLRARDAEIPFAVVSGGPIVAPGAAPSVPLQRSPVANLDPDFSSGFRAGFGITLDSCNEVRATYTQYNMNRAEQLGTAPPFVVRSMVSHPSTFTAASDGLLATGQYGLDFDLVDVDYRRLFSYSCNHQYAALVGIRYARLDQAMRSQFAVLGQQAVATDIQMDGLGVRIGLDLEQYFFDRQLLGYLRTNANFVASDFRATYQQVETIPVQTFSVNTAYNAGRIVTMLDLEIGGGWQSRDGTWRVTGGYLFNSWFNVIKTDEWVQGVQTNNFLDLGSTLTFDGFVGRVEMRF